MAAKRTRTKGLLPEAFKKYPTIARMIFAYNTMHALFPRQLTRKLPGKFGKIFNIDIPNPLDIVNEYGGPAIPSGFNWAQLSAAALQLIAQILIAINTPPVPYVHPPTVQVPLGYQAGPPIPPAVSAPAAQTLAFIEGITTPLTYPVAAFPQGWSRGEPLPKDINAPPGTSFPVGWRAGDPLPEGMTYTPGFGYDPDYAYWINTLLGPKEMLFPVTGPTAPWGFGGQGPGPLRPPGYDGIALQWFNCTDDTYWEQIFWFFTWTGTAWRLQQGNGDGEIRVNTSSAWFINFRPSKIRITYTGPTIEFMLTGQNSATILPLTQLSSGQAVALDFSTDQNIKTLAATDPTPGGDVYITKIEFFG